MSTFVSAILLVAFLATAYACGEGVGGPGFALQLRQWRNMSAEMRELQRKMILGGTMRRPDEDYDRQCNREYPYHYTQCHSMHNRASNVMLVNGEYTVFEGTVGWDMGNGLWKDSYLNDWVEIPTRTWKTVPSGEVRAFTTKGKGTYSYGRARWQIAGTDLWLSYFYSFSKDHKEYPSILGVTILPKSFWNSTVGQPPKHFEDGLDQEVANTVYNDNNVTNPQICSIVEGTVSLRCCQEYMLKVREEPGYVVLKSGTKFISGYKVSASMKPGFHRNMNWPGFDYWLTSSMHPDISIYLDDCPADRGDKCQQQCW